MIRYYMVCAGVLAGVFLIVGCAPHKTSQVFMAENPETGERAVYRLEVRGAQLGGVKYYFTATYMPRIAIDVYQGKIPPTLAEITAQSASISDSEAAKKIQQEYHQLLADQAVLQRQLLEDQDGNPQAVDEEKLDCLKRFYGELMESVALNASELRSIGEANSIEPYEFRKLVYFISTEPLRVTDFEAEVKEIQGGIESLAGVLAQVTKLRADRHKARRAQREANYNGLREFLKNNPDPKQYDLVKWAELLERLRTLK